MQTLKTNLFATSTKVKEATKKNDKKVFKADLSDKVQKFAELKAKIDALTGELKMIEGDIKAKGKELFLSQYKADKRTPENFKIQDETGNSCMFIMTDKYTMVDENKAEILKNYDNLLNESVTYKFNSELIDKYGEVISELICGCGLISEEDKANLITGEKTFSVQKGSIDRLMQYDNPDMIFELISPICSLKK